MVFTPTIPKPITNAADLITFGYFLNCEGTPTDKETPLQLAERKGICAVTKPLADLAGKIAIAGLPKK